MKTFVTVVASALFAAVIVTPVYAQQPGTSPDQHHPAPAAGAAAAPPSASGPAMKSEGMPMMDMCRQMMGGGMAMPMMGGGMAMPMMGGQAPADPKDKAAMLEMHGEMMKAMGDIMMKHGRRMQGMKTK
jgi:hypothetical protein